MTKTESCYRYHVWREWQPGKAPDLETHGYNPAEAAWILIQRDENYPGPVFRQFGSLAGRVYDAKDITVLDTETNKYSVVSARMHVTLDAIQFTEEQMKAHQGG